MLNNSLSVYNGQLKASIDIDLNALFSDTYAYEVIRLIHAKPLFLELHLDRLLKSCQALKYPPPDISGLIAEIKQLIKVNPLEDINIKIMIHGNHRILFPIESHYPSAEQYLRGVQCSLLFEERENPEIKEYQAEIREKSNQQIESNEVYESILVNKQNQITEGSRSNLFFIKEDVIYTAGDAMVLGGITRHKVIEICEALSLPVKYEAIPIEDLAKYQSAFICGTSPGVLPIRSVDNFSFDVQTPVLRKIHHSYHTKYLNQ